MISEDHVTLKTDAENYSFDHENTLHFKYIKIYMYWNDI